MGDFDDGKSETVRFNGAPVAVMGILGGVAMATLVPLVILKYGQILGQATNVGLVIGAVSAGALISLTAAFFGVVIPTQVKDEGHENKEKLRESKK